MCRISRIEYLSKRLLKPPLFRAVCFLGRHLSPHLDRTIRKERISRILLFQGGGIGDVIRIFPLLKPLQDEFPCASLTVLSPYDRAFFALYPHSDIISETLVIDITGIHKSVSGKFALIRKLRTHSFDLIVCPQTGLGMIEFAIMSFLIGAPYRLGYDMKGAGFLYTTKLQLEEHTSIYAQNLDLLRAAGIASAPGGEYFAIPPEDAAFAASFLRDHGVKADDLLLAVSPFVIADKESRSPQHAVSPADSRTWPEENYRALISTAIRLFGAKVVLLGSGVPTSRFEEFMTSLGPPHVISAIGRTSVRQAAAFVNASRLLITNDSGLLHVALALQKPCVAVFGSTLPSQVLTKDFASCIPLWKGLPCSPCFTHQPVPDFRCQRDMTCLTAITVEDVTQAIRRLLRI